MSKTQNTVRTICEIGLFAALGFAIDTLQGAIGKGLFVNGGSIGFAMIAVIIIGYRRGFLPALLTGLLMGLLDFMTGPYIIHPVQGILDYITPYAFVSVSALFRGLYLHSETKGQKLLIISISTILGGIAKFFSHFFAGFWFLQDTASFAWNLSYMNPYLYCFIYNIAFMGPCIVVSIILLILMELKAPVIIQIPTYEYEKQDIDVIKKPLQIPELIISSLFIVSGTFLFIFFLIQFIKSYEKSEWDLGFSADGDSMLIFVIGFMLGTLGVIQLIKNYLGLPTRKHLFGVFSALSIVGLFYGIALTIKRARKGKPYDNYLLWIYFSTTALVVAIGLYILFNYLEKEKKAEIF